MSKVDTSSLARLSKALREMRKGVGIAIAERAAPVISKFAQSTFDNSADPYGVPWIPSVGGEKVTLRRSGKLEKFISYTANGTTKIRVSLGVPYAKYQIGKRNVYPRQGAPLPKEYVDALDAIVADELEGRILDAGSK